MWVYEREPHQARSLVGKPAELKVEHETEAWQIVSLSWTRHRSASCTRTGRPPATPRTVAGSPFPQFPLRPPAVMQGDELRVDDPEVLI